MTSKRHDSRATRGSLTKVIHGESETLPYASRKKRREQPTFDHTNWVYGELGEPLPIVPHTSDPSLKAVAVHKPFEAESLDVIRQGSSTVLDGLCGGGHKTWRPCKRGPSEAKDFRREL